MTSQSKPAAPAVNIPPTGPPEGPSAEEVDEYMRIEEEWREECEWDELADEYGDPRFNEYFDLHRTGNCIEEDCYCRDRDYDD